MQKLLNIQHVLHGILDQVKFIYIDKKRKLIFGIIL